MRIVGRIAVVLIGPLLLLAARRALALPPTLPPAIEKTVDEAVGYLKTEIPKRPASGEAVLGALALIKAGASPRDPAVQAVIQEIEKRCSRTKYQPHTHHYYVAGLEMMIFETIDPDRYRPEMKKILAYILAGQLASGAWYYPNQQGYGDTSITQYAVLGLWSAERAGMEVPASVWDDLAVWHLKTQLQNGAFAYHPGEAFNSRPAPALTIGGAANLFLADKYLFSNTPIKKKSRQPDSDQDDSSAPVYGVLQEVELDSASEGAERKEATGKGAERATSAQVEQSISRAVQRAALTFRLPPPVQFKMYYLYALERMAALGHFQMLGPHNWYQEGAGLLVKTQQPNGTWQIDAGDPMASAAFGVLFLVRSTAQMLGHPVEDVVELGAGLLAGGRGLPSDLSQVRVAGGEIETTGKQGALGQLLARLEAAQVGSVPEVERAIVDSVRFGDREKLLNQRDRVRQLVDHPRDEVRRTAFWVLGRAGELADVPALIVGLSDPAAQVAVEARNGLCVLARRPLGFGLRADPFAGLGPNASEEARAKALASWSRKATNNWKVWYGKVAPYEARDGLGLFPAIASPRASSPSVRGASP